MTTAFDTAIPDSYVQKAKAAYGQIAQTQDGQKAILQQASSGDETAAIYLYDRLKKVVAKAFWKYYLGPNKRVHQKRMQGKADVEFVSLAFELLLDGDREPSPYKAFDASKFSPESDLIKQFGYYLYRYLQNEAFKLIRRQTTASGTGSADVSYDALENSDALQSETNHADQIDAQETSRAFYQFVLRKKPELAPILKLMLQGFSTNEIAKKIGRSQMNTKTKKHQIQELWGLFNK